MVQNSNQIPVSDLRPGKFYLDVLSAATNAYVDILRDALPLIEADGHTLLRELINGALLETEWGTPAAILMAVREIGES